MKCSHSYKDKEKKCPHDAEKGSELCIWHLESENKVLDGRDFQKLDLDEAYLVGANLDRSNLEECSLNGANLHGASVEEANLKGIVAKGADFTDTQMRKVDLRGSYLKYSNFESAIMANSDLGDSDLSWVVFKKAIMTGSQMQRSNLLDANLENAILLHASLASAVMRGTILTGADLQVANLRKVDLRGANLKGSNVRGADLREANLKYSNLEGAILANSNLQGAELSRSHLKNVYLQGASLQDTNFRDSDIEDAILSEANLEGAVLRGANLKGADIYNANLHNSDSFNAKIEGIRNLRYAKIDDVLVAEREANDLCRIGNYDEAIKLYDEAIAAYIDLKNYFGGEGLYGRSGDYYVREWMVKGKLQKTASNIDSEKLKETRFLRYYLPFSFDRRNSRAFPFIAKLESWFNWAFNKLLYYTAKYGESPVRVLTTSISIIIIYGLVYWSVGGISMGGLEIDISLAESIYFSAVTFTTLGYGDYQPKSDFHLLAISEAFIGAFVLAFFVVVVSRKLIR